MGNKERFYGALADGLNLHGEPVPGITLAEIWGSGRLLIEHHSGVVGYSPEQVLISVSYGQMKVTGENLVLSLMTKEKIIISGRIREVSIGENSHAE